MKTIIAKTYLKKSDYNKINLLYIFVFTIFLIIKILIFDLSRIDSFSSFFIVLFMVGMIFLIKFLIEEIRLFIKFKSDPKTFGETIWEIDEDSITVKSGNNYEIYYWGEIKEIIKGKYGIIYRLKISPDEDNIIPFRAFINNDFIDLLRNNFTSNKNSINIQDLINDNNDKYHTIIAKGKINENDMLETNFYSGKFVFISFAVIIGFLISYYNHGFNNLYLALGSSFLYSSLLFGFFRQLTKSGVTTCFKVNTKVSLTNLRTFSEKGLKLKNSYSEIFWEWNEIKEINNIKNKILVVRFKFYPKVLIIPIRFFQNDAKFFEAYYLIQNNLKSQK